MTKFYRNKKSEADRIDLPRFFASYMVETHCFSTCDLRMLVAREGIILFK